MRRLGAVMLLALAGCPDWDAEQNARCQALHARTGVCVGDAGRPGIPEVGALAPLTQNQALQTFGSTSARVPVFLWEAPLLSSRVIAVERRPGYFSVWRSGSQGATEPPHDWCASAASDEATVVGVAYAGFISVDELTDGGDQDWPSMGCPSALAAYRSSAGPVFLAFNPLPTAVRVQRAACKTPCMASSFTLPLGDPEIGEAVTETNQSVWLSAASDAGQHELVALELPRESTVAIPHVLGSAVASRVHVELATFGTSVHAAWVEDETLWLVDVSRDGGANDVSGLGLSEPARLVDLVESANAVVAVLEFSGLRTVLLVRDATGDSFYRLEPGFLFQPKVAQVRSKLRIAGRCLDVDGGVGTTCGGTDRNNPVLELDRLPGGGPW